MLDKVNEYIRENELVVPDSRVLAAVSGGADSVCLLLVLRRLQEEWEVRGLRFSLRVLHVHHGLRGEEADRDEGFVRELCGQWGIHFEAVHFDVAAFAAERGFSTEEAGRILRYQALDTAAEAWERDESGEPVRIALAHHGDDNAETILHHLLRGSGLRGLSGMRPREGRRIRPLLCVGREQIECWLRGQGQIWCEDSSNHSDNYTRNRIRHHVLPLLTEQINSHAVENIVHAGKIFAQTDAYLAAQADALLAESGYQPEDGRAEVRLDLFAAHPPIIRTYLLRRMIRDIAPGQKDITARHYEYLQEFAGKPVGSEMDLPGNLRALRGYETLRLERRRQGNIPSERISRDIPRLTPEYAETCVYGLQLRLFPLQAGAKIPKNQYTKWFDYDKIKDTLCVRRRGNGDYLTLPDGKHKQLRRYLIDEKIPREQRDRILLLAEGEHILWVVGYRISEYYKITEKTRWILEAKIAGGGSDGGTNQGTIVRGGSQPTHQ
ncbi:MAG: tRNA lysidine(34) synthetase TilS [Clostridiales bacterium]|nr:tRNA lysidine(34) synthetase TilS [Clostridiales bacterium]